MGFDSDSTITMITDYGISIVLLAIVVYVIIKSVNLVFQYVDSKICNVKHDKGLQIRQEVDNRIDELISSFVETHGGHRIQVIEFSNTVQSVAYLPFKYMTCTYEVCAIDSESTAHMVDHLPTSLFSSLFAKHVKIRPHKPAEFYLNEKLKGTALYHILDKMGEHQILCNLLETPKNKDIGLIVFYKHDPYTDSDRADIDDLSKSIQSLLSVMESKLKIN